MEGKKKFCDFSDIWLMKVDCKKEKIEIVMWSV